MVREKQEIHNDGIVIESVIFETKLIPLSLTKDNACHCEDRNKRYRRSNVIRNTRCVLIDVTLDVYRLIKQVTKHSTLRGDHTPCLYECESHHGLNRGRNLEIGNDTINCRKRRKKKRKKNYIINGGSRNAIKRGRLKIPWKILFSYIFMET